MSRHSRTKLVPPKTRIESQTLEVLEETSLPPDQKEDPVVTELDNEIECPRCNDIMELNSKFDSLMYFCENCGFLLKCV
ncbi:MAG: hypothetical protein GEU26_10575 [Nitrososphaeraceae archaeon]|nr:hypothetical protein [Nitrososphaeraceae archaeon]